MDRVDLYQDLQLNQYFDGGSILYQNLVINLNSKSEVIQKLDDICLSNNFTTLNEDWEEITIDAFENLLQEALHFNIGFLNHENMPLEESKAFYQKLTSNFNLKNCRFFTNWYNNPWKDKQDKSIAASTISDATIDLVISIVDSQKILFFYILFED